MNEASRAPNNFDFLRLCAASIVVIGHAFPIMGLHQPEIFGNPISVFGVIAFFSISGYLITGSWLNDPNLARFFVRRSLRILPALIVLVALSAFVLGPLESSLPLAQYLSNERTYNYLKNAALYVSYDLPGLFIGNPIANSVNGSLWSLPAEFFMYLITPAALIVSVRRPVIMALLAACFAACAIYIGYDYAGPRIVVYATEVRAVLAMGAYFLSGAFLRVINPRFAPKLVFAGLLVYALLSLGFHGWSRYPISVFASFAISYAIIAAGTRRTPLISSIGTRGDISYGLYLYAFPIQQMIAAHFPHIGAGLAIALAFALTVPCAITSWHLVEKRAIRIKGAILLRRAPAFPAEQTTAGN